MLERTPPRIESYGAPPPPGERKNKPLTWTQPLSFDINSTDSNYEQYTARIDLVRLTERERPVKRCTH